MAASYSCDGANQNLLKLFWIGTTVASCPLPNAPQHKASRLNSVEDRIAPVNSTSYRAMRTAIFAEFAKLWEEQELTQYKPSTLRKPMYPIIEDQFELHRVVSQATVVNDKRPAGS